MAVQITDSMFQLDEAGVEDNSISDVRYSRVIESTNYLAGNNQQPVGGQTLRFIITPGSEWIQLARAYLQLPTNVCALVNGTQTVLSAANCGNVAIGFANNFPLFSQARLIVDGITVENTSSYLHLNSLMKKYVDYSDANSSSFIDNLWSVDTGGGQTDTTPLTSLVTSPSISGAPGLYVSSQPVTVNNRNFNQGFSDRLFFDYRLASSLAGAPVLQSYNYFSTLTTYKNIKVPICDIFDFFRHYDKVLTGSQVTIELDFNQNLNQLFVASGTLTTGTTLTTRINTPYLWVPYVKPSTDAMVKLSTYLAAGLSTVVPYERVETQLYPYDTVNSQFSWPVTAKANGRLTRVFIILQHPNQLNNPDYTWNYATASAMLGYTYGTSNWWANNGTATGNPGTDANTVQLQQISLTYGGKQIPQSNNFQPIQYGLVNNYDEFLRVVGRLTDYEAGSCISSDTYRTCLTPYAFDMRFTDVGVSNGLANSFTVNVNTSGTVSTGNNIIKVFAIIFSEGQMRVSASNNKILYQPL
jgi:hypothetical protein